MSLHTTIMFLALPLTIGCSEAGGASSASAAASSSGATAASGEAKSGASSKAAGPPADKAAVKEVDKVMVECTWTKAYAKNAFGEERAEFEVKNVSGMDLNYVQFNIYLYDAAGKKLEGGGANAQNGQPWLKAGETKKVALSPDKAKLPAGTDSIECEVSAGSDTNNAQWKHPKMGHYDRPKGGVK